MEDFGFFFTLFTSLFFMSASRSRSTASTTARIRSRCKSLVSLLSADEMKKICQHLVDSGIESSFPEGPKRVLAKIIEPHAPSAISRASVLALFPVLSPPAPSVPHVATSVSSRNARRNPARFHDRRHNDWKIVEHQLHRGVRRFRLRTRGSPDLWVDSPDILSCISESAFREFQRNDPISQNLPRMGSCEDDHVLCEVAHAMM
mmetsp:Transcript_5132/g.7564  ORF Transcript_5132/g.7564 Transcript_5132/m.7564 type:complete len:204 (+) Transcript_5132:133-744(+)|eukprot:CAMPEP_0167751332 /NCGR_PEP_ID=MMETSP0110_2-20121227/6507_1 /TAXON_ID=629695 /ORGANISM="Gymnochlora sp., Strain CCMP2014" /LENGTH=203 /DNA_ID=CAMNT_0007636791 /DNA_START=72 /DNA_END=683 /DNA_ORIENTATION=+